MKHFTPERYIALQDFSSDDAMDAADAAWVQAVEQYDAYYRSVKDLVPAEYRRLQENYYLHDAFVLYLGPQGNRFVIALRLDPPPKQILQLNYELIIKPVILCDVLPWALREQGSARWLHDEIDLITSPPADCVHSILLSNGWEVRLPFRSLRVEEVEDLLPALRTESPTSGAIPETETV